MEQSAICTLSHNKCRDVFFEAWLPFSLIDSILYQSKVPNSFAALLSDITSLSTAVRNIQVTNSNQPCHHTMFSSRKRMGKTCTQNFYRIQLPAHGGTYFITACQLTKAIAKIFFWQLNLANNVSPMTCCSSSGHVLHYLYFR